MDNPVTMLTIKEIPEHFPGLSEHATRQLILQGQIPAVRIGKKFLCAKSNVERFLLEGNNTPEPEQTGKIRRIESR